MQNKNLAFSYAHALFEEIQEDESRMQEIARSLLQMSDYIQDELKAFLQNPVFEKKEKLSIVKNLYADSHIHVYVQGLMEILIKQNHVWLLSGIYDAFLLLLREKRNEFHVQIQSAKPLSNEHEQQLRRVFSKLTRKKVVIESSVHPQLIAGIVAVVGDLVYDLSIQGYLTRLQEEFSA